MVQFGTDLTPVTAKAIVAELCNKQNRTPEEQIRLLQAIQFLANNWRDT